MITPKVSCNWVCFNNWFKTTLAFTSRRNSITIRIPLRSDSSRRSVMPSTRFSFTNSAIFSMRRALFTRYGISVTMIRLLPFGIVSMLETARTRILPRPVRYASSIPALPRTSAPVGKSGPLMMSITSSMVVSRFSSTWLSMILTTAPITSRKL